MPLFLVSRAAKFQMTFASVASAAVDGFAGLFNAVRTERVGLPRPSQRGLGLFPGLEKRLVRPLRSERRIWIVLVEELDRVEGGACCFADRPIDRPQ